MRFLFVTLLALASCFGENTVVKAPDIINLVLGILQSSNTDFSGKTDFAMFRTGNRAIFRYAKFKYEPDFSNINVERE